MLILYAALKHDYGNRAHGYSFEHYNFFDSLNRMGHDVLYFDLGKLQDTSCKARLNRRLLEIVRAEQPEVMFTILFREELDRSIVTEISRDTSTRTVAWFCDDHWRFYNYTRHWAPCFGWSVTTARSAVPKYIAIGYNNVIHSQWACNQFLYQRANIPPQYDVTFVGQPHGERRRWIDALRRAGIDVQTWGSGWESGRLTHQRMIEVFNASRINLNLSKASSTSMKPAAGIAHRLASRITNVFPSAVKTSLKKLSSSSSRLEPETVMELVPLSDQIKGRNFEVPGCGGFMLTGRAEDLESYYEEDREVVCFETISELIDKIHYYLSHEDARNAIAAAAYRRTLNEHTYVHRLTDIFRQLRLPVPEPLTILARPPSPGKVVEVN
jgi:spore maturation protein CgeB